MQFRVLWAWLEHRAHLAVVDAEVTLCAVPVSHLVLVPGVQPHDDEVPWCWVCTKTART